MNIYKITNTFNNKLYIGQTKNTIKRRFSQHISKLRKGKHGNSFLQLEFNTFGEESFIIEVIENLDSTMNFDINNLERYWIKYFDSTNPEKGYNKTSGGLSYFKYNNESKQLNSDKQTRKTKNFIPTSQWKKENPKELKQPQKSKKGQANPMFGKPSHNRKKVRCKETGQVFESLHEAGRVMKILVQNISHQLKGRYKQTGGHTFEYVK